MIQPYFYSIAEFFAMGKHGVYVWSCWGITVLVVLGLIWFSRQQRKQLLQQLRQQSLRNAQRQLLKQPPNSHRH